MLNPDIIFCGLSRSGNHPIIYWYLDNIAPHTQIRENTMVDLETNKYIYCNDASRCAIRTDDEEVANYGQLVFSHEDVKTEGDNVFYICRDFMNLMASRIKKWPPNGHNYCKDFDEVMDVWIHNHTANINNSIIYNEWILSKTYRNKVADKLGIHNNTDNYDRVPAEGSGSSFIGRKLECSPTNYTERYKQVDWQPEMLIKILKNKTLVEINEEIYGVKISDLLKETT